MFGEQHARLRQLDPTSPALEKLCADVPFELGELLRDCEVV